MAIAVIRFSPIAAMRTALRAALAAFGLSVALAGCTALQSRQDTAVDTADEQLPTAYSVHEEVALSAELLRDFERALHHLQAEEYSEGIAVLEALVEHPQGQGNTAPYINLGIAYRLVGKLEEAEQSLQKALAINPDHLVASNEYAMVLRRRGRFQEARGVYERVLATYPEFLPARKNLGILCDLFLGDLECALEQYSAYLEAIPQDERVAVWIADVRGRLGL